VLASVLDVYS